ncbi:hypothetical protein AMTR_s01142p00007160, partial [Amborella trichopoda]
ISKGLIKIMLYWVRVWGKRGHPVVESELLVPVNRAFDPMKMQGVNSDVMKEILINNHVIKTWLESGLKAWLITTSMVPIENVFSNITNQRVDMVLVKDTESLSERYRAFDLQKLGDHGESLVRIERKMAEMAFQKLGDHGEGLAIR